MTHIKPPAPFWKVPTQLISDQIRIGHRAVVSPSILLPIISHHLSIGPQRHTQAYVTVVGSTFLSSSPSNGKNALTSSSFSFPHQIRTIHFAPHSPSAHSFTEAPTSARLGRYDGRLRAAADRIRRSPDRRSEASTRRLSRCVPRPLRLRKLSSTSDF